MAQKLKVGGGTRARLPVRTRAIARLHLDLIEHLPESGERDALEEELSWWTGVEESEALEAKGYDYRYVFSRATKHCDRKVFEQTLADTLIWMWRGYHSE